MKKAVVITLVTLGTLLLAAGATIFAIGVANNAKAYPTQTKEYEVASYSKVNINLNTADLEFKVGENGESKVVCVEEEKQYHTVEVKDDTLSITAVDAREWYEKTFSFHWNPMKVTVYVPAKEFVSATIKAATGNVVLPESYTFGDIDVKCSTGNADIASDVTGTAHVESSTGNIHIDADAEVYDLTSSTGNVYLEKALGKTIKVKTSTGNIRLNDSDATALIDLASTTGDINAVLLTGKMFEASTKTGRISVPVSTPGGAPCRLKTTTGRINVTVKA